MATIIKQNSGFILFKDEDKSTKYYDCPFCLLHFDEPSMRKQHVLGHFLKNSCNKCDLELIKVCDDWYALHPCYQNEPEIDCEPPAINFIEVKIEDPCDIDDSMTVNDEIEMVNIEDLHYSNTTENITFDTHLGRNSLWNQPEAKEAHEQIAPLISKRDSYHPHRTQNNLKCDICNKVLKRYDSMIMHMESYHMPKEKRQRTTCEICGKKLYTPRGVKRHMENHRLRSEFTKIEPLKVHRNWDYDTGMPAHPHQTKTNVECDICGVVIKKYHSMVLHMESKHMPEEKRQRFSTCGICDKRLYTPRGVKRHMEAHRLRSEFTKITPLKRPTIWNYGTRAKDHPHRTQKNLECDICGLVIDKYASMVWHMETKHIPKWLRQHFITCEICDKRLYTQRGAKRHMDTHRFRLEFKTEPSTSTPAKVIAPSEPAPHKIFGNVGMSYDPNQTRNQFRCETCTFSTDSITELERHVDTKHPLLNAYKISKYADSLQRAHPHRVSTNLECDICKAVLSSFKSMVTHMEAKHMPKEKRKQFFTCTICQKKIFTPKGMSIHMKNHRIKAGEIKKPTALFVCSYCGKEFPNKNSLYYHENVHTGKSRCDQCGKELCSKGSLKKHIELVHLGIRQLACSFENCEATFTNAAALRVHRARIHDIVERPNPCPICGKDFPRGRSQLNRHLKAHQNNRAKEYIKPAS